jgi:hypothetical protein
MGAGGKKKYLIKINLSRYSNLVPEVNKVIRQTGTKLG